MALKDSNVNHLTQQEKRIVTEVQTRESSHLQKLTLIPRFLSFGFIFFGFTPFFLTSLYHVRVNKWQTVKSFSKAFYCFAIKCNELRLLSSGLDKYPFHLVSNFGTELIFEPKTAFSSYYHNWRSLKY